MTGQDWHDSESQSALHLAPPFPPHNTVCASGTIDKISHINFSVSESTVTSPNSYHCSATGDCYGTRRLRALQQWGWIRSGQPWPRGCLPTASSTWRTRGRTGSQPCDLFGCIHVMLTPQCCGAPEPVRTQPRFRHTGTGRAVWRN